jgi:hypothetical protein
MKILDQDIRQLEQLQKDVFELSQHGANLEQDLLALNKVIALSKAILTLEKSEFPKELSVDEQDNVEKYYFAKGSNVMRAACLAFISAKINSLDQLFENLSELNLITFTQTMQPKDLVQKILEVVVKKSERRK